MLTVTKIEEAIKEVLKLNEIAESRVSILNESIKRVEICIAKEDGTIDLNECEKISKEISKVLDDIDQDEENYMLDVCSFGAEKELNTALQIQGAINQYIHVDLNSPMHQLDAIEGTLLEVSDEGIRVEHFIKGIRKNTAISNDNIRKVRLAVKF